MKTNLITITTSVVFWEGTTKAKAKAKTKQVCFAIIMILSQQQTSPISTKSFFFFCFFHKTFYAVLLSWNHLLLHVLMNAHHQEILFRSLLQSHLKRSSISGERFFHTFSYLLILFSNKFVLRRLNVNEIDPVLHKYHSVMCSAVIGIIKFAWLVLYLANDRLICFCNFHTWNRLRTWNNLNISKRILC